MSERRFDEAALLEWLLCDPGERTVPRAELERLPADAAALAELERFLGGCRSALREAAPGQERAADALAERVLARTTREDLSWRGDLRLIGGFVRSRLRSSLVLRVAAASLLVHVLALPVVAWYGWFQTRQEPRVVRFEPPEEPPLPFDDGAVEPEPEPAVPAVDEELAESERAYVERSLALGRAALRGAVPEPGARRAGEGGYATLLRARLARLAGRTAPAEVGARPDATELALGLEAELDALLLGEEGAAGRARRLQEELAAAAAPADERGLLLGAALARAESYGALAPAGARALDALRRAASGAPEARALVERGAAGRAVAPLDARWCALAEAAVARSLSVRGEEPGAVLEGEPFATLRRWRERAPR